MRCIRQLSAAIFLALLPLRAVAQECPDVRGISDINCDGKLQITFVGDSIVRGFGDTENKNKGGYVLRLQKRMSDVVFQNVSANGLKTEGLLEILKNTFDREDAPLTKAIFMESDVVILDIGRNDRLVPKPVQDTYRSLRVAAEKIRKEVFELAGFRPVVVTSVMMIPGRQYLVPFVKKLNSIILKGSSIDNPADLRFDKASGKLLSKDKLHPSSNGYEALSQIAEKYVTTQLPLETKRIKKLTAPPLELTGQ